MALESLTLDPAAVSTNTPLLLQDPANGLTVMSVDFPAPDRTVLFADSIDTEGADAVARKYNNRTIPIVVRAFDVSPGDGKMAANVKKLQQKIGRMADEGGFLGRVDSGSAGTIFFEVEDAKVKVPSDNIYAIKKSALCEVELTAKPLGFGPESTGADHVETVLPVLTFTEASIPGDVPALGRLVVDNDQAGQDQLWLQWGVRSKNYGTATSNALKYEAETRLPQGGAILAARSGASGGTVVRQGTLTTSYQSMMSLASSGTAYLSHVGSYQVMGRVFDPGGGAATTSGGTVGNVTLALEWAEGDFVNTTRNDAASPPLINDWSIVDFGQVRISQVTAGAQRWDGRVLAKGTDTNQTVDVDHIWLVPIDEGSGRVTGGSGAATPTSFVGRDEFTGIAAGTLLNGRTAPVGGVWTTAGAATDFAASDNGPTGPEQEKRSVVADPGGSGFLGRYGTLGSTNYTDTGVQVTVAFSAFASVTQLCALARWVDANNAVVACLSPASSTTAYFQIEKTVAGTRTTIALDSSVAVLPSTPYTITFLVFASGRAFAALTDANGNTLSQIGASDAVLATGGALATGKPGIRDFANSPAIDRYYDNFFAYVPVPDAAVFANQSLELRSDRIRREDQTGTVWAPVTKYEGSYLRVPPSGQEGRTSQFILKASRGDPASMPDSGIDDISAQLFITPRYLNVPES